MPTGLVRGTARLLLLGLAVTTLGPAVHGVHDVECDPLVVLHDESQHHFAAAGGASPFAGSEHCLACHFHRTSRGPVSWEPTGVQALASGSRLFHSDGQLAPTVAASPRPARAPPTLA